MGLTSPAIHDATTNPEDPPQFVALAKSRRPGMNSPVYDGSEQIYFQRRDQHRQLHAAHLLCRHRPHAGQLAALL